MDLLDYTMIHHANLLIFRANCHCWIFEGHRKMTESFTLLLSKMSSLFILLDNYGIKREEFFRNEGIDPVRLNNSPDSRVSLAVVRSMMSRAEFLTGDKTLGLHQGEIYAGLPSVLCYLVSVHK